MEVEDNPSLLRFSNISTTGQYKAVVGRFAGWENLIEEAVKSLIADLKTYEDHDYIVMNGKIGYKDQDGISYDVTYGYKTLFAYFKEHAAGKVNLNILNSKIALLIKCSNFLMLKCPVNMHVLWV